MTEDTLFGGRSRTDFMREYWQKRPLLVRGAFPEFKDPLSAEDLAGLACEGPTESRLVLAGDRDEPYALRYGPFQAADFERLPEKDWTLLVRHVDKLVGGVGALLDPFRFLPRWRIDDIMVSYAVAGGTVGPHVDEYDVFLLQGHGRRRWQIATDPDMSLERREDTELDVLAEFRADEEWELDAGDMLYLPPGVAHHGVAVEPCLTYSIGFRAPSRESLLAGWFEHLMQRIEPGGRYADPDLRPVEHPGKIDKDAADHARAMLEEVLRLDAEDFRAWFGTHVTRDDSLPPVEPGDDKLGMERLKRHLDAGRRLVRNPMSRVAYLEHGDGAWLFVDGRAYQASLNLAGRLGDSNSLRYQDLRDVLQQPDDASLLIRLINEGHWLLEEPANR